MSSKGSKSILCIGPAKADLDLIRSGNKGFETACSLLNLLPPVLGIALDIRLMGREITRPTSVAESLLLLPDGSSSWLVTRSCGGAAEGAEGSLRIG
eukprot:CAMPEP_0184324326 /NCGR_PEP_ID=MMETSP1049-20130417/134612_1 /TAXON_ID=77928 /ORGANISM="Proteomonas sulcata, Strain CCMP704" /LENGTH=96 /DNA_ID=CAMNT_0026646059 /DNA_START=195 /DNA_END=481 /DNA_ORIENTATION=+